ncbi:hypothetical protein B296_00010416 [Ensete ventricosum]|uniref:Uncharacterized protein n=1 Tax=Ensete ventricosum TaxID=4639 RepID=A0A427B034_ENSVE|nr:hypothetical protein B296_00010416 [Ensete ventricosum]
MAAVGCRLDHHRLSRAIVFCSSEQAIDKAVRFVFRDCDPKKAPLLQPRKGMEYKSLALLAAFLNHGKKKTSLDFLIPVIGSVEKRATAARVWGSCGRGWLDREALRRLEYELWTREPMSVQDRRKKFFMGMGFDELVPSPGGCCSVDAVGCPTGAEESTVDLSVNQRDIEKIMESSGSVSNSMSSPDVEAAEDSLCCIRDLDSGRKFIVHELGQDGLPSMLKEVGSGKLITLHEFEDLLGLSCSDGRHIISVGEDSNVYIWNYNGSGNLPCIGAKSIHSSEFFFSKGVSVAVPWPGVSYRGTDIGNNTQISSLPHKILEPFPWLKNSDCFSLGTWLFSDGSSKVSATWPEEKLPSQTKPQIPPDHSCEHSSHLHHDYWSLAHMSGTWNLVIVTAGSDGTIRSFHNYGLPVQL